MSSLMQSRPLRLVATLALAWLVACDSDSPASVTPPPPPTPVASVAVSAPTTSLLVGEQATLTATPRDASGKALTRPVTWRSDNVAVATVSAAGVATAVAPGTASIVATSEGREGELELTVALVPVAEVRLSVDDEVQLEWNAATQISATAHDAEGNELLGRAVQWLSSNDQVATVSQLGVVQARGTGTTMIGATIGGITAHVGVRVKPIPVARIVLDAPATALEVGEEASYAAVLEDAGGQPIPPRVVTWTSSDPTVATVQSTHPAIAAVTALSAGPVTITASIDGKSTSVSVMVTPHPSHDVIYNRWTGTGAAEIFILELDGGSRVPERMNAGAVSRDPSPSPDGTRFVFAVSQIELGTGKPQNDLFIVDRTGLNVRRLTSADGIEDQPMWSPDGTKILFHATDEQTRPDLWVVNVDGTGLVNLTAGLPADITDKREPAWSADGSRIAFVAARNGQHKIWTMNADGSNAAQLTTDPGFDSSPSWSPGGDRIAFSRYNAATPTMGEDIMIVSLAGGAPVRLALAGDQRSPAWSPDGHYLVFAGTTTAGQGLAQIYTMRPNGDGLRLRTTNAAWGGGLSPSWIKRP